MGSRSFLNKFRGSLLGVLIGDCLASPFEMLTPSTCDRVNTYLAQLLNPKIKIPYKPYTDDTAMTIGVTSSLIQNKGLNPSDMAKRFTLKYFAEPKRGYGSAVHDVFVNFQRYGFDDPFYAAQKQFNGQGSFGNGAAMRATPLGLFCHGDIAQLINATASMSRITHSHHLGVQGAILQSLAVREALYLDGSKPFDSIQFIDTLLTHMVTVEKEIPKRDSFQPMVEPQETTYTDKLLKIKEFLSRPKLPTTEEVEDELGVGVAALHSVPTAIYAFVISNQPIPGIETDNPLLRSILYSISLGGDTDTIASMAAGISGALLGDEVIPRDLLRHCEKPEEMLKLAEDLFAVTESLTMTKTKVEA